MCVCSSLIQHLLLIHHLPFFQIASVLEEAWAPEYTYIGIIVDVKAIQKLQVGGFDFTFPTKTLTCFFVARTDVG